MIGIFDSGIGGLTVVRQIKRKLPELSICYFGDIARVPWGGKSPQAVRKYSEEVCDFLISRRVNRIVIACNTASALAGEYLGKKYPQVEFFDVITPVVERVGREKIGKIGVIGTQGTIRSGVYEKKLKKINKNKIVFSKACPLLVPLAEEGWTNNKITKGVCEKYLKEFRSKKIEALILGCTHYPLLKAAISLAIGREVNIISSADEVAGKLSKLNIQKSRGKDEYYFSDWTQDYQALSQKILGYDIKVKIIKL